MKKLILLSSIAFSALSFAQSYCTPTFYEGCYDGDEIDSFTIPTANFSHLNTGCATGDFSYYNTLNINLTIGNSYPYTITHNFEDQNLRIWIDFDKDGTFNNNNEKVSDVIATNSGGVSTSSGTIAIPSGTAPGTYRMRVATEYDFPPAACGPIEFGEVHDYNVVLTTLSTQEVNTNSSIAKVYPNPFTDYIKVTEFETIQSITINDASGKLIKTIDKISETIDLKSLHSGIYFMNIVSKTGNKQNIKIVKK